MRRVGCKFVCDCDGRRGRRGVQGEEERGEVGGRRKGENVEGEEEAIE